MAWFESYGNQVNSSSGNWMQLYARADTSYPSADTCNVRVQIQVGTRYPVSDSYNSFSAWGDAGMPSESGSRTISHGGNGQWTTIYDRTFSVSRNWGSNKSLALAATLSGIEATPGTSRVDLGYVVEGRPYTKPNAPTGVTSSRVSDTQINTSWTRNPTTGGIYSNQSIRRRTNSGSWVTLATNLAGTATSYSDTTTTAGNYYEYAVQARNANATGDWSGTGNGVVTTPKTPSSVSAEKNASGGIVVSWSGTWSYPTGAIAFDVEESTDSGASWTRLATNLPTAARSWTHVGPDPAKTHLYRVRAGTPTGNPNGAWRTSNTVQLQAPPNAPTIIGAPSPQDASGGFLITWTYSPIDSSPQRKFQYRYKESSSSAWFVGSETTSTDKYVLFSSLLNNKSYDFQVRTWGAHADPSPWSSTWTVQTFAAPVAGVTAPSSLVPTSLVPVMWSFFQENGQSQVQAQVSLVELPGDGVEEHQVGQWTVPGSTGEFTPPTVLPHGSSWRVEVRAQASSGLWSDWDTQVFNVDYPSPAAPQASASWSLTDGSAHIKISNPPDPTGGQGFWRKNEWPVPIPNNATIQPGMVCYTTGTSETVTESYITGATDGPPGITSYKRFTINTPRTDGFAAIQTLSRDIVPFVGEIGDVVTLSMWVRYSDAEIKPTLRIITKYGAEADVLYSKSTQESLQGSDGWVRISHTITLTDPCTGIRFWLYQTGSSTGQLNHAGATYDVTGICVDRGESSEFFDGTFPNCDWTGVANASPSVQYGPVKVNLATNPTLTDPYGTVVRPSDGATMPGARALGGVDAQMTTTSDCRCYIEDGQLVLDAGVATASSTSVRVTGINTLSANGISMSRLGMAPGNSYAIGVSYSQDSVLSGAFYERPRCIQIRHRVEGAGNLLLANSAVAENAVQTDTLLAVGFTLAPSETDVMVSLLLGVSASETNRCAFRNLIICEGNTEEEALAKVQSYFDGDTPDYTTPDGWVWRHEWEGTPGASRSLAIATPAPVVVSNTLQHLDPITGEWVTVAEDVPPNGSVTDFTAPLVDPQWRVIAYTADGASATYEFTEPYSGCSGYVGRSSSPALSFSRNINIGQSAASADSELYHFAGRQWPVMLEGPALSREITLSWMIVPDVLAGDTLDPTWAEWVQFAQAGGVVVVRTVTGIYAWCAIRNLSVITDATKYPGVHTLSLDLVQVESL